ncbi:Unknown protein [Gulosibacter molinativorax]|nr:Unknown protein [Gulosibacter molinativorax]
MRSRYSAFALGLPDYLLETWHRTTRPPHIELDPVVQWRRLDVVRVDAGGPFDTDGVVEFEACYRGIAASGDIERGVQHEVSRFVRESGRWYYVSEA